MARHHTFLILGIVLMIVALISKITGRTLVKYGGIIRRTEDPKTFWQMIALDCVLGFVCFGLYLYTVN